MAYLRQDKRTQNWYICFRWGDSQHNKSCRTQRQQDALTILNRVKDTLQLLKTGRLELPHDVDPSEWIFAGGKVSSSNGASKNGNVSLLGFGRVCDDYYADQTKKAPSTLMAERVHIKSMKKHFGTRRRIATITLQDLKKYMKTRLAMKFRGKYVTGATVKKEFTTFRQLWIWSQKNRGVQLSCPLLGPDRKWEVHIPKPAQKLKFQTWQQIERRIKRGGLSDDEITEQWRSLFLDETLIAELLGHVQEHADHPFQHPMFVFAAYTGARRSEICRSRIDDFDFEQDQVLIRERKRRKDLSGTTRFVPMHPKLRKVMQEWFEVHPGGQYTIVSPLRLRGQIAKTVPEEMRCDSASYYFRSAIDKSTWSVLKGFHTLRHSFGSNLARTGKVPSEVIATWMGHTTDEMRELYHHLFPQDGPKQIQVLR